jgi:phosphatidylglycerophosphatase C
VTGRDLAAFDLDGTLTRTDCVVPFLRRVAGSSRLAASLARRSPLLLRARRDRACRDDVKAALVADLLAGMDADRVRAEGERFAAEIATKRLRDDVAARLRWHVAQGHEVLLVTASFAAYAIPLATRLGADGALATELEVGPDGRLTGRLDGANCRAEEKVARLRARYGPDVRLGWAYGDSPDDRPLLAAATRPFEVGAAPLTACPA